MEAPPRRKPITYGKQSRRYGNAFGDTFLTIDPAPSPHRLTTPKKSYPPTTQTIEKSDSGVGDFEVPSSDDGSPRSTRPRTPTGKLSKITKRGPPQVTKPSMSSTATGQDEMSEQPTKKRRIELNDDRKGAEAADAADPAPRPVSKKIMRSPASRGGVTQQRKDATNGPQQLHRSVKAHQKPVTATADPTCKAGPPTKRARSLAQGPRARDMRSRTQAHSQTIADGSNLQTSPQLSTPPHETPTPKRTRSASRRSAPSTPSQKAAHVASPSTRRDLPSTPVSSSRDATPNSKRMAVSTPRQTRLWSSLLGDETESERPNETPSRSFTKLAIEPSPQPVIASEIVDTPRKRRLIDSLKSSAQDNESPDDVEPDNQDIFMVDNVNHGELNDLDVSPQTEVDAQLEAEMNTPHDERVSSRTAQASTVLPVTHKYTYGEQRTYRRDAAESLDELLSQPLDVDLELTPQPGARNPQAQQGKADKRDPFDMSDDESGPTGLRSIFELRAAGNSRESISEMEGLIDELKNAPSSGIAQRRKAVIELFKKLNESKNMERFFQSSGEHRILQPLQGTDDQLTLAMLAGVILEVLSGGGKAVSAAKLHEAGVTDLLIESLETKRDLVAIAKNRSSNMSKVAQTSVAEAQAKILQRPYWKAFGKRSPSPQLLGLSALERLVRKLREAGNVADPFMDGTLLSKLIKIMKDATLRGVEQQQPGASSFEFQICLSILESCSISQACVSDWRTWVPEQLESLVACLDRALKFEGTESRDMHMLVLRLTINLANGNESNAKAFAHGSLLGRLLAIIARGLGTAEALAGSHFDLLVLALGALINLAECSKAVRGGMLEQMDQIDQLVRAFVLNRKNAAEAASIEASTANVAYGYLAILFGHLCQTHELRLRIMSSLPDGRLDLVIEAVEEFMRHHAEADKEAGGDQAYSTFTERMRMVVDTLRSVDV